MPVSARSLKYLLGWLIAFNLGYVAGHLFWGKDWVPDQKADAE